MKIKGSKGRVSRTRIFNSIMIAVDVVVGGASLIQEFVTPLTFLFVFMTLGMVQNIGNMWLRQLTTGPLK